MKVTISQLFRICTSNFLLSAILSHAITPFAISKSSTLPCHFSTESRPRITQKCSARRGIPAPRFFGTHLTQRSACNSGLTGPHRSVDRGTNRWFNVRLTVPLASGTQTGHPQRFMQVNRMFSYLLNPFNHKIGGGV